MVSTIILNLGDVLSLPLPVMTEKVEDPRDSNAPRRAALNFFPSMLPLRYMTGCTVFSMTCPRFVELPTSSRSMPRVEHRRHNEWSPLTPCSYSVRVCFLFVVPESKERAAGTQHRLEVQSS